MTDSSFSAAGYCSMLEAGLSAGYKFISFDAPAHHSASLVCLLRHDVDADVDASAQMAAIESELGIVSTYFFMVRSPIYNLFSRSNEELVLSIIKRGHFIGLHFDEGHKGQSHLTTNGRILFEAEVLARNFDVPVRAVSFHQPGAEVLDGRIDTGGLINTYSKTDLPGFHYLSDSNRQWRSQDPLQVFRSQGCPRLQLLIHPMWWMYGQRQSTADVWDDVLKSNFTRAQEQLLATERAYGGRRELILERADV